MELSKSDAGGHNILIHDIKKAQGKKFLCSKAATLSASVIVPEPKYMLFSAFYSPTPFGLVQPNYLGVVGVERLPGFKD